MAPAQETASPSSNASPLRLIGFVRDPDDNNLRGFEIKDSALLQQALTHIQGNKWPEVFAGDLMGESIAVPDSDAEMKRLFPAPAAPAASTAADPAPTDSSSMPAPAAAPASPGTTTKAASTTPSTKAAPPDTAKGDSSPPAGNPAPSSTTAAAAPAAK